MPIRMLTASFLMQCCAARLHASAAAAVLAQNLLGSKPRADFGRTGLVGQAARGNAMPPATLGGKLLPPHVI